MSKITKAGEAEALLSLNAALDAFKADLYKRGLTMYMSGLAVVTWDTGKVGKLYPLARIQTSQGLLNPSPIFEDHSDKA